MKRSVAGFFWMSVLALALAASPAAMAAETVQIGALFPFSGELALLGQESFNGATIASDMVNEKGGIWGKQIEWIKGDAVDPKAAMAECERLISVKGMKIILGTYSSSRSYAASEVAERNKVIYWEQLPTVSPPGASNTSFGPSLGQVISA
jgi:branched-chain amino acid transport system substrate-binding protein